MIVGLIKNENEVIGGSNLMAISKCGNSKVNEARHMHEYCILNYSTNKKSFDNSKRFSLL